MDFQAVSTGLQEFLERGGPVLVVIMATTFVTVSYTHLTLPTKA